MDSSATDVSPGSLPGDAELSEAELDPDGALLPSRLMLPCPLLTAADAGPPPLPSLQRVDQLPIRDLQVSIRP